MMRRSSVGRERMLVVIMAVKLLLITLEQWPRRHYRGYLAFENPDAFHLATLRLGTGFGVRVIGNTRP